MTAPVRTPPATADVEAAPPVATSAPPALEGRAAMPVMSDEEIETYPRSTFLSIATLGLGGVIGGAITLPVLGFAVLPSFTNQDEQQVELGPLENFPEGEFVIATYLEDPEIGEVTRRTMFVRNNGQLEGQPSFTLLYSRCAHLGCPVQPNGPIEEDKKKTVGNVELRPVLAVGFGCPCHGGQYDTEGNRTAGPPVRALDRAEFSIKGGKLVLGSFYSVSEVSGTGARARIKKYGRATPGVHVDGPEAWLYPDRGPALVATATRKKSPRRAQIEAAVLYPLDWLEERSGLVGATKYFLFRKVPRDSSWFHTLGSATLTAFLVQAITGVILAFYYKPDPDKAYASIQMITNDLTLGWLVRGMHRWGASVFIILMFFHMARVFLFGAYKYPRELNWIIGVNLLALGMLEGFTGYLLPWDQTAYWATVVGINLNGTAPVLGPFLAQFLSGGAEIGADTLSKFYALHMLAIPGGIFALIGLHLYLVIRLGVSSPPWSPEAAGRERPVAAAATNGREGLVRPGRRGGSADA